jgi:hypothetical protein
MIPEAMEPLTRLRKDTSFHCSNCMSGCRTVSIDGLRWRDAFQVVRLIVALPHHGGQLVRANRI